MPTQKKQMQYSTVLSNKLSNPLSCSEIYFSKTENFKRYFTRIFCVQIYAKLQSFVQLRILTLTNLCHIMRDHLDNFYVSLKLRMNGHLIHQTSIHLTIVRGVQRCRHFTNLLQSRRPSGAKVHCSRYRMTCHRQ